MVRSLCSKRGADREHQKKKIWSLNLKADRDNRGDNNNTYLREIIKCRYGLYSAFAVAKHLYFEHGMETWVTINNWVIS